MFPCDPSAVFQILPSLSHDYCGLHKHKNTYSPVRNFCTYWLLFCYSASRKSGTRFMVKIWRKDHTRHPRIWQIENLRKVMKSPTLMVPPFCFSEPGHELSALPTTPLYQDWLRLSVTHRSLQWECGLEELDESRQTWANLSLGVP